MIFRSLNTASPAESVATVVVPLSRSANPGVVTITSVPATGLPPLSVSRTETGAMVVPAGVFCGCCTNVMVEAPPAMLVRAKVTGPAPATPAVTV